jgi:hypothetical protein
MHWSQRYVGMAYAQADCAALFERVQREVFGRDVRLPSERASGIRGLSRQIDAHRFEYAVPTAAPNDGDGVLMIGRGQLNHIGVYCLIDDHAYVLHAMRSAGYTVRHAVRELIHAGLRIEGYYRLQGTGA